MNTKTTLFLLLAAVVAGGVLLLVAKPWKAPEEIKKPEPVAKPLFEPKPEGIDHVEVVLRDGRRVFTKQGDEWTMTEPVQTPANTSEVDSIIRAVGEIKYKHVFAKDDKDRPKDSVSGMDKPVAIVKLVKNGTVAADVTVGSQLPTGTGNYIRLGGKDDIRQSESDLSSVFNKRLDSYRDRQVLKLPAADIKRVKVEGAQSYTLVKNADSWVIESPVRARADKGKADGLVRPLANLYVQEWQKDNPSSYALYQLDEPRLKLTVEAQRTLPARSTPAAATRPADSQPSVENKTYVLMIGGSTGSASNGFFARVDSSPAVFSLPESTVKELTVMLSDLQDKAVVKVDPNKVKKVEVQAGGETASLTKNEKGQWAFADATQADPAAVEDVIRAVADLKATSFADPRMLLTEDWKKPRARLALTVDGQVEPVTVLVGGPTASGRMVYVRNQAEEPVAAVNEDLVAPLLQPPVSYRNRQIVSIPRERVSKLEVTRPNAPPMTLTKTANKWSMVSPVEAPADNDSIRNVLTDLSSLQAKRVAGVGNRAQFGLDKPEITLAMWVDRLTDLPNAKVANPAATQPSAATKPASTQPVAETLKRIETLQGLIEFNRTHPEQAKPEVTELLSQQLADLKAQLPDQPATQPVQTRPATSQAASTQPASTQPTGPELRRLVMTQKDGKTYAALDDGPTVWELDNRIREDAGAEFHDRQVAKFDVANVTDLTLDGGKNALIFRKIGEDWKYQTDQLVPIDKQKVNDVLNVLRELKTHRYVDYAATDLARYGFNEEPDNIIVGLNNGQRIEILLSSKGPADDTDKSRYAMLANTKKVFLLKGDQTQKFSHKLEDFVKSDKPAANTASAQPPDAPPPAFGEE